jgi:hypothetical protein
MEFSDTIMQSILDAISEVNETVELEQSIPQSEDTVIFGPSSQLDSLALITLLTAIEENIEEELGEALSLADLLPTGGETVTVASFARTIAESRSAPH